LWVTTTIVVAIAQLGQPHHTARHYFDAAARLLLNDAGTVGETGLHLYGSHPEFQFGPPAAVAMVPFTLLGSSIGGVLLTLTLLVTGLLLLGGLVVIANRLGRDAFRLTGGVIVGGAVYLATWCDLAVRTAHIDDVLALAGLVAGVLCCTRRRPWTAAVLIGLGAAAKPWAVGFVVVAAAPPGVARWLRPVVGLGVAAACWAPFVLADGGTLDTSRYGIDVKPESVLALAGLDGATTPGWCRPVQLATGLACAAALVARRQWAAAPLAVVTVRLAMDPDVNRYYTVAFVVAALLFEWLHRRDRLPWLAVVGALVLETTEVLPGPSTFAGLPRLMLFAAAAIVICRAAASPPLPSAGAGGLRATSKLVDHLPRPHRRRGVEQALEQRGAHLRSGDALGIAKEEL
jgi:hypothetical protein